MFEKTYFNKPFPKILPKLSKKNKRISDKFIKIWHHELVKKKRYNFIEGFNHNYSAKSDYINNLKIKIKTLELGAGIDTQISYENLSLQDYYCVELRSNLIKEIKRKYKMVRVVKCDIQKKLPFRRNFFDRINVVHVLEHLPNLPKCLSEVSRVLKPKGIFQIVIPCDPGLLYGFCRKIPAERVFKNNFKGSYSWLINREHINTPNEIINEIKKNFKIIEKNFFPFVFPSINLNLFIGLTVIKK